MKPDPDIIHIIKEQADIERRNAKIAFDNKVWDDIKEVPRRKAKRREILRTLNEGWEYKVYYLLIQRTKKKKSKLELSTIQSEITKYLGGDD